MENKKLTGPYASSIKYDLLTALSAFGLRGTPGVQTSMLRLIAIVTARYNWKLDELSLGQHAMAKIWACDLRTAKREVKRLTGLNVLIQIRPGVRGRVGAYRLNYNEIYKCTESHWQDVGPDFTTRMTAQTPKVLKVDFKLKSINLDEQSGIWKKMLTHLAETQPEQTQHWYSKLMYSGQEGHRLTLTAQNEFTRSYVQTRLYKALNECAYQMDPNIHQVKIIQVD